MVLRVLPMRSGIEDALRMYAEDTTRMPTFALEDGRRLIGFVTLREHVPTAWEIRCMAISANARGKGHGSRLLADAEAWPSQRGAEFLQVKTVASARPGPEYGQTRKFYEARGFTALEIFPELWNPRNPAPQCIKRLNAV